MQINTDISPIISPKSNISTSFISPRDVLFTNMHLNKNRPSSSEKSPNDAMSLFRIDQPAVRTEFDISHQGNTTNESYSLDKNMNGKSNSKHITSLSSQQFASDTHRESEYGEGASRQMEPIQPIEYEEFCIDRTAGHTHTKAVSVFSPRLVSSHKEQQWQGQKFEMIVDKKVEETSETQQVGHREGGHERKELPSPRSTAKKFVFEFVAPQSHNSHNGGPAKRESEPNMKNLAINSRSLKKSNPSDLPLQDRQMQERPTNDENLNQGNEQTKHVTEQGKNNSKEEQISFKIEEQLKQKDDEIDFLKARIKYLEDKRAEKAEVNRSKPEHTKCDKETLTADLTDPQKEKLEKENDKFKLEIKQMLDKFRELQELNASMEKKIESQSATIQQLQEKNLKTETSYSKLMEECGLKEKEMQALTEERKVLINKKTKLKSLLRQRDNLLKELKQHHEEAIKPNQSEQYHSALDKLKTEKEKLNHLHKQLESQKEIIKQKDAVIDGLLAKMDSLTDSKNERASEISNLKNQIKFYQEQFELPKKEPRTILSMTQSHKSSVENLLKQHERSSDKIGGGGIKRGEEAEGLQRDSLKNKQAKNLFEQKMASSLEFQFLNRHEEGTRSVANQDSQESGMLKLREFTPEPETSKYPTKRGVLKSSDPDSSRNDNDKETKNDLQKRLSYLKYKRAEFEKRREQKEKQEQQREKDDHLQSSQQIRSPKFGTQVEEIQTQESRTSPFVFSKKAYDTRTALEKKASSIDKENLSFKYNQNQLNMEDLTPQTTVGNSQLVRNYSNFSDGANSRPSSKTPPKIENHHQFNRTENKNAQSTKSGIRYSTLLSNPSTSKHETSINSHKIPKKSNETGSTSHSNLFKFESPGKFGGTRSRSDKERPSSNKNSGTPSANQFAFRAAEKTLEYKSKK